MRDRKPAGNMLWAVLFCFAATFGFTGCGGSIDNVPTDANLSNLTVTPGALQPPFSGHITDYTVDVATSDTSVTVTAKPQDAQATVKINGQVTTSRSVSLGDPGFSTFVTIDVTSFNGNRKTYLVTVNRNGGNNNLQNLTVTSSPAAGPLTPAFEAPGISGSPGYTVAVASSVTSVTVTATLQDTNATMTINGQGTSSGQARTITPLNGPGLDTLVTIEVTAPNGSQKTYLVTVNRAAIVLSGNNNLSALDVSAGALEPPFDPGTTSYSMTVPNATKDTTVTATVADSTATLTINGSPATSGVPSASIHLDVGPNSILIVVTAQNGTPNPYTVLITRERKNSSED